MAANKEKNIEFEEQNKRITGIMDSIKNRIVVFSGKGGVGKTTVSVNLAYALVKKHLKVGLLDADITGPNVPKMTGANSPYMVEENSSLIKPNVKDGLSIISIESMVPKDTPVIWRGPLRSNAIRQFLGDVIWGELDFLLADLPPGTGDEVLTSVQSMKPNMAIVVTTPQEVSLIDCRRAVNMAKKMNIPIIGVVENMAGLVCPYCEKIIEVFGSGGGESMAGQMNVNFLGRIPMEINNRLAGDQGKPMVLHRPESQTAKMFDLIADSVQKLLHN
ncbi:MAG: Mrp/NBP35 family ATP-binding protein [Calditrichaceae bacterium]|nr:Mrp/NBP35 family ATP-binding protein [Calditrichaceae bacterium]MBN2708221.1 Mrp/NBP35 family ATP-binding protein [Calditrichaceae bacterium]RQV92245.1 MAG: ATP-binding protein [Calditrichota bacterium]